VAFHALQALAYQVLPIIGGILLFACYFCSFFSFFLIIPGAVIAEEAGPGLEWLVALLSMLPMGLPFCIMGLAFLLWLAYVGYGLYAAVRVFQGHDFRYAAVGRWVERYLEQDEGRDVEDEVTG